MIVLLSRTFANSVLMSRLRRLDGARCFQTERLPEFTFQTRTLYQISNLLARCHELNLLVWFCLGCPPPEAVPAILEPSCKTQDRKCCNFQSKVSILESRPDHSLLYPTPPLPTLDSLLASLILLDCLNCFPSGGWAVQLSHAHCLRRSTNRNQSNCWGPHRRPPPRTDWASVCWTGCNLKKKKKKSFMPLVSQRHREAAGEGNSLPHCSSPPPKKKQDRCLLSAFEQSVERMNLTRYSPKFLFLMTNGHDSFLLAAIATGFFLWPVTSFFFSPL